MPLTREFKETIQARIERDPAFREELLKEGVDCLLSGDVDTGKVVLRDYINATIGFQELSGLTEKSPKSLMRMFGPNGNPQARNLFEVIRCLQEREGLSLKVRASAAGARNAAHNLAHRESVGSYVSARVDVGVDQAHGRISEFVSSFEDGVRRFPTVHWLPDESGVWWLEDTTADLPRIVSLDGKTGDRRFLSSQPTLRPLRHRRCSSSGGKAAQITLENYLLTTVELYWINSSGELISYGEIDAGHRKQIDTHEGHIWLSRSAGEHVGIFEAESGHCIASIDSISQRAVAKTQVDDICDSTAGVTPYIHGYNVAIRGTHGKVCELSTNGSEKDQYCGPFVPSPDAKMLLAFQETSVEKRNIPIVESSPTDQVHPKLHWRPYQKPGDELPQRRPRLFDLVHRRQIAINDEVFEHSFSVEYCHWSSDGEQVYLLVNRRGHQQLLVVGIDTVTGDLRTVVDERSETFIDYSQKRSMSWLKDGTMLWMSERDGYNHLYRIDARSCVVVNQVTCGPWNVRRVELVDADAEEVWFSAVGIHSNQDPYHEHLARVRVDGTELTVLTCDDGTHSWRLNQDRTLFIDRWSRVDLPTVTDLRHARDGSRVARLGSDDATALLRTGFRFPERFVAKGRDGETDIYGVLIRPVNFDAKHCYPVIEEIYAGPHHFAVPKAWEFDSTSDREKARRIRRLSEFGFIVVQIDGMGTNWRSKDFHNTCWKNLRDAGLPDRIQWLRAASEKYSELDLNRVGIYGGSAGGQNALAALLFYGDFYVAGAADCGCHDNRMDKLWWNEAWMGEIGPHYEANSNVTHAAKLKGKLLLTVGELDENVDPASTLQVVSALVRAGKQFEFVPVPGAGHGIGDKPYLERRRTEFFLRTLLQQ